jgi:hypothetical protein
MGTHRTRGLSQIIKSCQVLMEAGEKLHQINTPLTEENYLAREALSLRFGKELLPLSELLIRVNQVLIRLGRNNQEINGHPIVRYLATRIRNLAYDPDASMALLTHRVEVLACLED